MLSIDRNPAVADRRSGDVLAQQQEGPGHRPGRRRARERGRSLGRGRGPVHGSALARRPGRHDRGGALHGSAHARQPRAESPAATPDAQPVADEPSTPGAFDWLSAALGAAAGAGVVLDSSGRGTGSGGSATPGRSAKARWPHEQDDQEARSGVGDGPGGRRADLRERAAVSRAAATAAHRHRALDRARGVHRRRRPQAQDQAPWPADARSSRPKTRRARWWRDSPCSPERGFPGTATPGR